MRFINPRHNEFDRLAALDSYKLIDTPAEDEFDDIVKLAADIFDVPISLISFISQDRQFFKAKTGIELCGSDRDSSFCSHTLEDLEIMVVSDATIDARFRDNPFVLSEPFIRFYAGAPIIDSAGHGLGSLCIIDTQPRNDFASRDKSLLKRLARLVMTQIEQRKLISTKTAALKLAATIPDAIICTDDAGTMSFWNASAERLFGYTRQEAVGQSIRMILPDGFGSGEVSYDNFELEYPIRHHSEALARAKNGTKVPIELSFAEWGLGNERKLGTIIRDVTERHQAQKRAETLAFIDRLTGLPNRQHFIEAISKQQRSELPFCVMKIALDKFRQINSTLGMAVGDSVLEHIASILAGYSDTNTSVARLGGDEFGVLISGAGESSFVENVAERFLRALDVPCVVSGTSIQIGASIGLFFSHSMTERPDAHGVLKCALLALQKAKSFGGGQCCLFEPLLALKAMSVKTIGDELKRATANHEFELFYQPQYRLSDQVMVGAEALLRWHHPTRGLLQPAAFIAELETSPYAPAVGSWIIDQAAAFAADMAQQGCSIRVGVNLFAAQLVVGDVVSEVITALNKHNLPAKLFEIEITETTVLKVDDAVIGPLNKLRDIGVGIAFDDYGTGFASLSLLKKYPLSRLKIDREFISDLETNADDATIVKAVLAMARGLKLDVIAEGIETSWQSSWLTAHGCNEAQGYFFSKPVRGKTLLPSTKRLNVA